MAYQDPTQLPIDQPGTPVPLAPYTTQPAQEERLNQILTELKLLRYAMGKLIGEALIGDNVTDNRQGDLI